MKMMHFTEQKPKKSKKKKQSSASEQPLFSSDFFKMRLPTEKFGVGKEGDEEEEEEETTIKMKLKRIALHFALASCVIMYIIAGAVMFQWIEMSADDRESEQEIKDLLDQIRFHVRENVTENVERKLREVLDELISGVDLMNMVDGVDNRTYLQRHDMYSWESFPGAVLFTFTVVSTIGYGHMYPVTTTGRLMCILYTICGIPLFMISVADVGKFLWEMVRLAFRGRIKGESMGELPLSYSVPFLVLLFFGYMVFGALMIPLYETDMGFVKALYMNFISMTTVGFGDVIPLHPYFLPVTLLYIFFGLALTTLAIEVLATGMRRFHYLGYGIKGARLASVWVGGKLMSMDMILKSMAREMGVSEEEVEAMANNFDEVLDRAHAEYALTGNIRLPTPDPESVRKRMSRKQSLSNGALLDSFRSSGQYDNHPDNVWEKRFGQVDFVDDHDDLDVSWMAMMPDNA